MYLTVFVPTSYPETKIANLGYTNAKFVFVEDILDNHLSEVDYINNNYPKDICLNFIHYLGVDKTISNMKELAGIIIQGFTQKLNSIEVFFDVEILKNWLHTSKNETLVQENYNAKVKTNIQDHSD